MGTFSMATIALLLSTLVALGMAGTKVTWPMKKSPFSPLPKYTTVFGVPVFADKKTSIAKFQHVASVLASWLDNDQDGCADNPLVIKKLTEVKPRPAVQINDQILLWRRLYTWSLLMALRELGLKLSPRTA